MDRGHIGVLPRTTSLADESYLDFVETFRVNSIAAMSPLVQATGNQKVASEVAEEDIENLPLERIRQLFNELPVARTWQRFMRSHQEMMWRCVRDSFSKNEQAHLENLKASESKGPGKLIYDSGFKVPDYARHEIHLQPGGYTDDPLGGIVFHYGTKVFYLGGNDQDELHIDIAQKMTAPEDGKVERVLDIGCSIGQCTTVLKSRYPDAEVWGLDVGLPLLRYAHKRAVDLNVDVNFIQALAEDTKFPDGHFDAVLSYILFHEVPLEVMDGVLTEMHRILRPGGTFSIYDFPAASSKATPGYRFLIDYDSRDNCEPYSPAFVKTDMPALLRDKGFDVRPGEKPDGPYGQFLQVIYATRR